MLMESPDALLIAKARHGDKQAFSELVQRYEKKIFSMALSLLQNQQDAEDITQEVFVRAYFSLKSYRSESKFFTWLYRIAYNMSIDFKRRSASRIRTIVPVTDESADSLNFITDQSVKPADELIEQQELSSSLKHAMLQISEEHRAVMILREVDGLSYDEIARITGSAKGTVMSRLHYARRHLQKVLSGLIGVSAVNDPDDSDPDGLEDTRHHRGHQRALVDSGLVEFFILFTILAVNFFVSLVLRGMYI